MTIESITPFLWFDDQAEEAARFYISLIPNSKIRNIARYGDTGPGPAGGVMIVDFELGGREFLALNGGPAQRLSEAFSLTVACTEQSDIDRLWNALTDGGSPNVCGWLKDRFGLSWQLIPVGLPEAMCGPKRDKALEAVMKMTKFDIGAFHAAIA